MTENEISRIVFELGMKVHRTLGPGLLEGSYEECSYYELCQANLKVERQKILPVIYDGIQMETYYKIDLMVEDKVILKLKAVEKISDLHLAQLLTYLKLSNKKLGLLVNFNTTNILDGIKRVVNNL